MSDSPNIIIIMADQLRYDLIGKITPNICELMQDSVQFKKSYCVSPLCVPSRGAFFTGTYPTTNGCLINPWEVEDDSYGRLKPDFKTFYELFESEWDFWHTGKQHLLSHNNLEKRNDNKINWLKLEGRYEDFLEKNNIPKPGGNEYRQFCPEIKNGKYTKIRTYSIPTTGEYKQEFKYFFDGFILNDSMNAIGNRDKKKPFCLSSMFLAPHPPLQIPEPYYNMYQNIEIPENVGRWYNGQSPLQLYQLTGFFGTRYSREQWKEIWRVYAGLVTLFDDCVGKLIKKLKDEDLYENSIIIFTSDHGEMLGSHGLWQKMCLYEESLRVPLSIKLPYNKNANTTVQTPVSHLDVLPTILDLTNKNCPQNIQGKSLLRFLTNKNLENPIFAQFDGNGALGTFQRGIILGDYKFMLDRIHNETFFELYNTKEDPQEMNNIIFVNEDKTKELIHLLQNHLVSTNDPIQFSWEEYNKWRDANHDLSNGKVYDLP